MPTPTLPAFLRHAQAEESGILNRHRLPDGSLDAPGLIAAAVAVRRQVQTLEAQVASIPEGENCTTVRERCAILQARDILHRRLLSEHVAGWDQALTEAHRRHPGAKRAKAMQRAAQSLGLWEVNL